jgi:stage II sporulation protein D
VPRRTPSAAVTGVLTILALGLGGASCADGATSAPVIPIPNHAILKIAGRGYGHGHGMSQYGAQGAARQGLSAKQIVAFYYPHTKGGHIGGKVRVQIGADTDGNTTVVNRSGLKVRDLDRGRTVAVPTSGKIGKATRWRMSSKSGRPARVSYLTGAWHVWRTLAGDGEFRASKSLRLVLPSGPTAYRGVLQSRTSTRGGSTPHRITVNKVSIEDYVRAVVPREAFPSWQPAALQAQAIAARSYGAYRERHPRSNLYELFDTTSDQVYGGKAAEVSTTNQATAKTEGQVRTFHGAPALTQFSASNGGWMSDGGTPYLVAKKDKFDRWSGNPYRSWTTKVTAAAVENAFPALGNLKSLSVTRRDGNGLWGGRIETMKLVGSSGTVTPSGDDFRSALGLRSTWFTVSVAR